MNDNIVIGAGFGDEGKGKVVSFICEEALADNYNPLVIRFSGGQQAGHHVMLKNGMDHVFSNFGSGTLHEVPTYWSEYCTVDPSGILNELDILKSKNVEPILYIDSKCPVTTPFEKILNLTIDSYKTHGSCGVGFGQTLEREKNHFSILFEDLFYPSVLKIKMNLLSEFYKDNLTPEDIEQYLPNFCFICEELLKCKNIIKVDGPLDDHSDIIHNDLYIFEGSQGLLLDQNFGFFPHVTRSNTGMKNIENMNTQTDCVDIWLVTRAYQTRHGNGPMTNEDATYKIKDNPYEKNYDDTFQGKFRKRMLDLDLIKYGLNKDDFLKYNKRDIKLVVTCMDLLEGFYFTMNGKFAKVSSEKEFVKRAGPYLEINEFYFSDNPYPEMSNMINFRD